MAVANGPARRSRPRRRPAGVGPAATWDAQSKVWREDEYWFDESAARKAVEFFPEHLVLTTGEWAGRPFVLEGWQERDIIRPLFGWKRADGTRRYRRCYVWVPRKNGKTEMAAGIAILLLVGDAEEGGEVYSIATDKNQARIVFDKASIMVSRSNTLPQWLECFEPSIFCPTLNASFKPMSGRSKGKHGYNVSGLVGDEIHEWSSGELYGFLHDSETARRQPLEFLISTAGTKGGYGEEIWNECLKIRDGTLPDPETLVVIYAAEEDDDWTAPAIWAKANPNLGKSKKLDAMATECRRAQQIPRLENDFKRYQLNVWTDTATRWLPIDAVDDDGYRFGWDHCRGAIGWEDLAARLVGKTCFGGLDLSAVGDLSALVWWFPAQDGLDVPVALPRFFKPQALLRAHAARDKLPYEQWAKPRSGPPALLTTPGNVVDYEYIRAQIARDAEQFKIANVGKLNRKPHEAGIAIDRWNAVETSVRLEQEGLPVALFGQGFASMSAPSKELERLVLCNGFHHGGHPVLRRHAQVAPVETDPAGNIKPVKNKAVERIDGIVAAVMALGIAMANPDCTVDLDDFLKNAVMVG